jgi:hypothetical protein
MDTLQKVAAPPVTIVSVPLSLSFSPTLHIVHSGKHQST